MEVGIVGQGRQTTFDNMELDKLAEEKFINLQENYDKNKVKSNEERADKDLSLKDIEKLEKDVDKLNKFMDGDGVKVVYERHDKFKNDIIIKIVDSKTGEVISEVPPKKILDMVAKICELVGVLFDKKA